MSIAELGSATASIAPLGRATPAASSAGGVPDASPASGTSSAAGANSTDAAVQDFLKIAKESPAERLVDTWLKAHGLTEESLAKLPPAKQAAIRKEMAEDIKKEMEHEAPGHRGKGAFADIVA